ncbi:response regulator transcription factor [Pseudoalteromonas denitrificans]|uniref:Two-component system, OmpR family, response regulator RegX3 n=1 Tax=Pseudoalteromonas denitrificans DSM 6059 TaxID=1123010 RepID=A0A1I1TJM1_9GAMM|nr:response regulator transcription factor [Pseudoalteromonas denitrificans]SFD57368.1 two-component system, OmpR family, response regulator RegX3 [Pseudoalteromonas denitrificans DSM 6059]
MSHKPKLLIIEDETPILRGLTDLFSFHGFTVQSEQDGEKGLETALANQFDCILLDVMLPSLDGFSICNKIREQSREQAIIMLTAKSAEEDIITGLTLGADDYISKPFSVKELVLRVKTILRRTGATHSTDILILGDKIQIDCIHLKGTVFGKEQFFTRREVDILIYLKKYQRPIPRSELLEQIWGYNKSSEIDTRTVDIHIAKLRKKIEHKTNAPKLLVTFRGEGYKLCL